MGIPEICPRCGNDTAERSALVDYDPDPNDAQAETDWGDDLPDLVAIICMECSGVLGVFDPDDILDEEDLNRSKTDKFRVEDELR